MTSFSGQKDFVHGETSGIGVLICNLGTPAEPNTAAVRHYLAEFLSDKRVVELSDWLWKPILHGFILRFRPKRSAAAYRRIWGEQGSPLLEISRRQVTAIQKRLNHLHPDSFKVTLAMRYGEPSISAALQAFREAQVQRIIVVPLYPQYASATTGSVFDALATELHRWRWVPAMHFLSEYYNDTRYLDALADSIERYWETNGRAERLLMSFHGIPEKTFLAGDPYYCQCQTTARELAERLNLDESSWLLSFQSRVGRQKWLQPYTDQSIQQLAQQGVRSLDVVCPGFSADCLETLEEIAMENAEIFSTHGGDTFNYIPALNDNPKHINFLSDLIEEHCQAWLGQLHQAQSLGDEPRQKTKDRAQTLAKRDFPDVSLGR